MFRDVESALEFQVLQRDLKRLSSRYCMDFTDTKAWCEILRGCQRSQGKRIHRVGDSKKGKRNKLQGQETLLKPIFKKIGRKNSRPDPRDDLGGTDVQRKAPHFCCCDFCWLFHWWIDLGWTWRSPSLPESWAWKSSWMMSRWPFCKAVGGGGEFFLFFPIGLNFEQRVPEVKSLVPEKLQQWRAWKWRDELIMSEEKSFDVETKAKVGCSRWQEVGRCLRWGEVFRIRLKYRF